MPGLWEAVISIRRGHLAFTCLSIITVILAKSIFSLTK